MTLFKIFKFPTTNSSRAVSPGAAGGRYLTTERLQAALQRERMRADRVGGMFSFVWFHIPRAKTELYTAVADHLSERLRLTDDFGEWQGGIGVVLPETSEVRARELARSVQSQLASDGALQWSIASYPQPDQPRSDATPPADQRGAESDGGTAARPTEPTCEQEERGFAVPQLFVRPLPVWKRAFDLLSSITLLILTSPLLALAAVAIKLSSPGPVLFCQRRAGLGGRPFVIYKLRTMRVDAESQKAALRAISEQDGPAFKLKNDPRVTTVGKYLRKTCIDELPQLLNVLRGDMTLVGPRPLPCDEAAACTPWQQQRLDVTPGLTCIWQVRSGRSRIAFADWMRLDIQYIRGRSLGQDLRLVWKTMMAVLMHRASH